MVFDPTLIAIALGAVITIFAVYLRVSANAASDRRLEARTARMRAEYIRQNELLARINQKNRASPKKEGVPVRRDDRTTSGDDLVTTSSLLHVNMLNTQLVGDGLSGRVERRDTHTGDDSTTTHNHTDGGSLGGMSDGGSDGGGASD